MEQNEKQIEIDLVGLFRYLKKRFLIVFASVLAFAIAGFLYTQLFAKPVYVAETQLYVLNRSSAISVQNNDFLLSDQILKDCQAMIKCKAVTKEVVETMDLNMSPEALAGKISVGVVEEETRILQIVVRDGNANRAAEIANTVCEVAAKLIREKTDVNAVNKLYEAEAPGAPSGPNLKKNVLLFAVIGLVLSVGVLTVVFVLDDSIRSEEDVERYLGLSVFGVIPDTSDIDTGVRERTRKRKRPAAMPKDKK